MHACVCRAINVLVPTHMSARVSTRMSRDVSTHLSTHMCTCMSIRRVGYSACASVTKSLLERWVGPCRGWQQTKVTMACILMAYAAMACIVMAYIVMAYVVIAYVVIAGGWICAEDGSKRRCLRTCQRARRHTCQHTCLHMRALVLSAARGCVL